LTARLSEQEKVLRAAERAAYKEKAEREPLLPWRQTPERLREMAREYVTGQAIITAEERVIRSAFYIMTTFMDWSTVDPSKVGAFYGPRDNTVPGRGMNGYPIFLSMTLIHVDDVPILDAHLEQMRAALA